MTKSIHLESIELSEKNTDVSRVVLHALAISLGPCVANGIARFSYALLLPAMREDLGWSYVQAGWINTVNAFGYLIGGLLTFALTKQIKVRSFYRLGLTVTVLAVALSGVWTSFFGLSASRLLAGIGSAPVFICGGVLAAQVAQKNRRLAALAITIYFGGSGLGIIAAGAAVPWILIRGGIQAWPLAWIVLAGFGAFCSLIAWKYSNQPDVARTTGTSWKLSFYVPTLIAYFLFACGYLVYMTFAIAWMQESRASVVLQVSMWSLLGLGVCLCPVIWRKAIDVMPRNLALTAACACTALGVYIGLVSNAKGMVMLSAAVFGLSFFAAPAAVMGFVRRSAPEADWNRLMSLHTVAFAIGQIAGPVLAGVLADASGSLRSSMWLACGLLLLSAVVSVLQGNALEPVEAEQ